jgi:hypothetical protein
VITTAIDSRAPEPIIENLHEELVHDFAQACGNYAEARQQLRAKDTPAHRTAVLDSRDCVDAVLDMYLMYLDIENDRSDTAWG